MSEILEQVQTFPTSNGRVDIMGPMINPLTAFSDRIPISNKCGAFRDAMVGNWMDTPLSLAFFSEENINIIQNGIKHGTFERSGGKFIIGTQNCDELKIIMRSVFLQNSLNQAGNIKGQIENLNNLVLAYAIEQIYKDAVSYIKYKRDASTMYVHMQLPTNSSTKGKTLELEKFV